MNDYWKKTREVYEAVNNLYPKDIPSCSKIEAGKAYRILLHKFGRKKHSGLPDDMKLQNLKTWSEWNKGWWNTIHMAAHRVYDYRKQYKNHYGHSLQQALLEKEMIEYALKNKWFDGSLKPKVLTKDEKKNLKVKKIEKLLKVWERKQKLALTYSKKYKKMLTNLNK